MKVDIDFDVYDKVWVISNDEITEMWVQAIKLQGNSAGLKPVWMVELCQKNIQEGPLTKM